MLQETRQTPAYFVLVLQDHVPPVFSFGVHEETSYRQVAAGGSTYNFTRFQYLEKPTATDNIDGDVSETITMQVTGPNARAVLAAAYFLLPSLSLFSTRVGLKP